jgi:tRNA threonylcarbamoyladenosine biosynthesis protein TsaB
MLLAIDTCGPMGSVALARATAGALTMLAERELEGRTYSATLTTAIAELLAEAGFKLVDLAGIVVVNGPGSFTGVRVGVSTAKGLAEGLNLPVVAVSRLAVLAAKADVASAALDAHRDEVFLRIAHEGGEADELLAGAAELDGLQVILTRVALSDDAAARLLSRVCPATEIVRVEAATASDALRLAARRFLPCDPEDDLAFVELAMLDGHYLRRSDAEIFGEKQAAASSEQVAASDKQAAGV